MQFGTEEQKREFLPRILRGKLHAAIGYTEPAAGTDLASLRTRAVKDGDDYVINGSKVFTSLANYADYIWLAARTDPDAPKHAGHLDLHGRHQAARLQADADLDDGRTCAPTRPTSRTCACRSRCWSAARTWAGR